MTLSLADLGGLTDLLPTLLDQSTVLIMICDDQGRCLWANQPSCQLLGYTLPELCSLQAEHLTWTEDWAAEFSLFRTALLDQGHRYRLRKRFRHRDGHPLWVTINATIQKVGVRTIPIALCELHPFQNVATSPTNQSEVLPEAGIIDELHRQLKALQSELDYQVRVRNTMLLKAYNYELLSGLITEELRNSLDEAKLLQTAVQELGLGLDLDNCGISVIGDPASSLVTFYDYPLTLPSISSLTSTFLFAHPEGLHPELIHRATVLCTWYDSGIPVIVSSHPISDEETLWGWLWMVRRLDRFPLRLQNSTINFGDPEIRLGQQVAGQCAIAIRQARLHQTMHNQLQELQRLHRLKDDFLNTVSHELRTPLTNMQLAIKMIRAYAFAPERREQYLEILDYECQREITLVSDLLDIQRLESPLIPSQMTPLAIHPWIGAIMRPFALRAQSACQHLRWEISPDLPLLNTNVSLFERIVSELLNNACKYTPMDETITLTIQPVEFGPSVGMILTVTNTGVTIPESELLTLFDPFFRRNVAPSHPSGSGLGLSLVRVAVTTLGGLITAASNDNQVVFTVTLPPVSLPTD